MTNVYEVRFYREWVRESGMTSFEVRIGESDLLIRAERDLSRLAETLLKDCRSDIEDEIRRRPEFATSLSPLAFPATCASAVEAMYAAARKYDVGPMAAVAGAVAEFVGEGLLRESANVIVENGGDIWLRTDQPAQMGLYAGETSPFSGRLRFRVGGGGEPLGVCTSSGVVGHSLSFGRADAVVAVSEDAALADAAATSIANRVSDPKDVAPALEAEKQRGLLKGLLIAVGKRVGAVGMIELIE